MPRHVVIAVGLFAFTSFQVAAQDLMERGRYLVEAVMACDGCHTPRGPGGADMSRRFSGGPQVWDEPSFTVRGSNITPDPETGIGKWSAADLKKLLVDGVRPNAIPVAPQMPFAFYKVLTPRDLDAVVAYTRSVQAVKREVPPPFYKSVMPVYSVPGGEKAFTEDDLKSKEKRGFYLGTIAHCMECHARKADGSTDFKGNWGRGGHEMSGPWGKVIVANITSHPTKGVGAWSDAELKRALKEGVARDGRPFKQPMARSVYFGKMTDDDLDAIVAWVRTLPPLE